MHPISDPELAAGLAEFYKAIPGGYDLSDIAGAREFLNNNTVALAATAQPVSGVVSSDHYVTGAGDSPPVLIRVYQPEMREEQLPAFYWIHGGGYILGDLEQDDFMARELVRSLNCVVAAVDYRLAPEYPFPAPLEDCYTGLKWLAGSGDEFNINTERIAIGGGSAGGGLAAGLALLARDRGEVELCYQLLLYPMLDDSNVEQASSGLPDTPLWSRANNLAGWKAYLGQKPGSKGISEYAAAIRAEDVSGLPPTYICVGTPDLFRDEDIAYACRLMNAGVPTELHVYTDGFHAFNKFSPDSATAQHFTADYIRHLKRALYS